MSDLLDLLGASQGWDAGAEIHDCYRYRLWRVWDKDLPAICWIMLNPSTADAMDDDPTVDRCLTFSRSWRYGGIWVVNLFAYRATDPMQMMDAANRGVDIIGPLNDKMILQTVQECKATLLAWGVNGVLGNRDQAVVKLISQVTTPLCLGCNQGGTPKHPLYLKSSLKPLLYTPGG